MKDDELETLVRQAFEEGVCPNAGRLREIAALAGAVARGRRLRRRLLRIGARTLAAASLVAAVEIGVLAFREDAGDCGGVRETIRILCAVDGIDSDAVESPSAGEMLLAWQDVPCAELLASPWEQRLAD